VCFLWTATSSHGLKRQSNGCVPWPDTRLAMWADMQLTLNDRSGKLDVHFSVVYFTAINTLY
jgi:hypothetical protein